MRRSLLTGQRRAGWPTAPMGPGERVRRERKSVVKRRVPAKTVLAREPTGWAPTDGVEHAWSGDHARTVFVTTECSTAPRAGFV